MPERAAFRYDAAMSKTLHKVAVIGGGRMGRHHTRTLAGLARAELVGVVDLDQDRAMTLVDEYGGKAFDCVESLLKAEPNLAAATVAVPTKYHVDTTTQLLEHGVACLVEKPLAESSAEAQTLANLAQTNKIVLGVGHTERFNPAVRGAATMNLTPRFIEVDRVSPMTFRSMDVGVVMDLMIHDLDIVLSLVQSPVVKVDAVGAAVLSEHEDIASARLTFASGCVANLIASRLALRSERRMKVFSEDAYVNIDFASRDGVVVQRSANREAVIAMREKLASGDDMSDVDYSSLISVEELTLPPDEGDQLTAEHNDFLNAVEQGSSPTVAASAGVAAVEAAEKIVASIGQHEWQGLDNQDLLGIANSMTGSPTTP